MWKIARRFNNNFNWNFIKVLLKQMLRSLKMPEKKIFRKTT